MKYVGTPCQKIDPFDILQEVQITSLKIPSALAKLALDNFKVSVVSRESDESLESLFV